jgi:TonB family protein
MVKVAFGLATLYSVYFLLLSRDTMYERNRFVILLSLLSAIVLPLVAIQTRQPLDIQFFGKDLTGAVINGTSESAVVAAEKHLLSDWRLTLLLVYLSGIIVFGFKLMTEVSRLLLLIIRQKRDGNYIIRLNGPKTSGFSAFGHVFIDAGLSTSEAEEIIRHEQKHLDQHHFFDIFLIEFIKVFQWFNPFIYLFDRSLRAVHEFQADEECLNSGITVLSYQGLILDQVFRTRVFSATNRFSNPTLIKKRMIMMTKKRSGALANLKIILVLPVLVLLLFSFSTCAKKSFDTFTGTGAPITDENVVQPETSSAQPVKPPVPVKDGDAYVVVEQMPLYPGGDKALLKFISENTNYPVEAKDKNIQGRVIVRFKVMDDGMVADASVIKGVDPLLDAEAVRVVNTLQQFTPGKVGGVPVPVWYMVPITFSLKSTTTAPPPPPPVNDISRQTEPFVVVEEMPMFPGGDSALLAYISQNAKYPEIAKTNKITGRVIVRFCITKTGSVERISVLKGVTPELDAESMRVVKSLPAFIPGKQGGVPVPVWYMIPVTFALN